MKHHTHHNHHKMMMEDFKKRFKISLILTIPILLLSPTIGEFLHFSIKFSGSKYLLFLISSFIFFWSGYPFLKGFIDEVKHKKIGMMTLIALAISVAYIYSSAVVFGLSGKYFFWELATLIDIMLLGHYIEMKSILGASKALEKLANLMPKEANLIKDGKVIKIDISKLNKNDIVLVKVGEKIPADGVIIEGETYIDESMLTGESKPIKKVVGSNVIGGSINQDSIIKIKVKKAGEESYLNKVIKLVKEAQESKSKTEKFSDIAARWLTIISISVGSITFIFWIISGATIEFAIERLATVMIITCPHALGLAIPLVNAVSTAISAKNGLLIKNKVAFEATKDVTTIVFDKTGTLTKGEFEISDILIFNPKFNKKQILQYIASLEKNSQHPIAKAIVKEATKQNIELLNSQNIEIIKGKGLQGEIKEYKIELLSKSAVEKRGFNLSSYDNLIDYSTMIFIVINSKLSALIKLSDTIRKESFKAVKELKKLGIKIYMLTGDNEKIAQYVSKELKLDGYFAEVLPHQKQEKIKELQEKNEIVAMTGDGINDAPALALADVGIAIGSGTDIAIESADIILINSNPYDIVKLIQFSKKTYKKMVQNLFWATGYNVVAIPLAAGALYNYGIVISPAVGAVLMSLSTIIVAINAKLLKF